MILPVSKQEASRQPYFFHP